MTKRVAEFFERLIRDEYDAVLGWMCAGCPETLWSWKRECRASAKRERAIAGNVDE
jgi:hypothetical protein